LGFAVVSNNLITFKAKSKINKSKAQISKLYPVRSAVDLLEFVIFLLGIWQLFSMVYDLRVFI